MKRILFLVFLIPFISYGQQIKTLPTSVTVTNNTYFIAQEFTGSTFGNAMKTPASQILSYIVASGGIGITSISIASANGFAGSSSGGGTPALTIRTTVTGLLKGNGTAISAAVAGTDYQAPLSGSGIVKSTAGTISYISGTSAQFVMADGSLNSAVYGTVTNVTGTANRITVATGTTTPVIDISSSYIGQSSITTLGTITTGVWNGTAITSSYIGSLTGGQVGISGLSATGTPSSSTYLRGDNTWATLSFLTNPMTTTGDIIYSSDNSGTPARLGIGAAGRFIYSSSGLPAWSGFSLPTSVGSSGKIPYSNGTDWVMSTPTLPLSSSATSRKIFVSDGTNWVASTETWGAPSTSSNFLMSDGTNWTSVSFQQYTSASNYTTSTTITSTDCRTIFYKITAQAGALLFNNPTGTFCDGQILLIAIKDNGTARALTYGPNFRAGSSLTPLLATTTISKWAYLQFIYNSTDTKWDYIGAPNGF